RAWIVLAVALVAAGFLLKQGLGAATEYFLTADQAVARSAQLGDQRFRLEGTVVQGTVARSGQTVVFCLAGDGVQVPVVNSGFPPQLFRPGIPVVVEGHFGRPSGAAAPSCSAARTGPAFAGDLIMVKHSADYVAAHPGRVPAGSP
ncbi:MAG TPA: cytochrome c maturation protein CcmE, partial [Acidimicrobiales bacterium]|nr:cytochrome c maturation protein CcmE [Acidimicrobiales bacterium]